MSSLNVAGRVSRAGRGRNRPREGDIVITRRLDHFGVSAAPEPARVATPRLDHAVALACRLAVRLGVDAWYCDGASCQVLAHGRLAMPRDGRA